jgi:hypothetical protein
MRTSATHGVCAYAATGSADAGDRRREANDDSNAYSRDCDGVGREERLPACGVSRHGEGRAV